MVKFLKCSAAEKCLRSIFPFFGFVQFAHVVSDFTGTLSVDRKLLPGIKERLNKISEIIEIHILTADTFCMAKEELRGVTCEIHILEGTKNDIQGERYVKKLGPTAVIFLGNGKKDRKMHKASRIDVSVLTEDVQSMLLRLQMSWFVQPMMLSISF